MAKVKQMVDDLIRIRSNGKEAIAINTRIKLLMKGIDAKNITENTPDDPQMIKKILQVADEFKIQLPVYV
jgi:hypothetical protein